MSRRIQRIDSIDGLRAIAMTMVIAQHCHLLPFGWIGVWLFFAISGLVITLGFIADEDSPPHSATTKLGHFMLRRVARIVPVYFVYVAVNVLILLVIDGVHRMGDVPYLMTFLYNWHMIFNFPPGSSGWSPFGHLWTLSVEEQFYLLYPWLALFAPRKWRLPVMLALVLLGPLVRVLYGQTISGVNTDEGWRAFAIYASSICQMDAFLVGALLAHAHVRQWITPGRSNGLWATALVAAGVFAGWYVNLQYHQGKHGSELLRNVFSGILYGGHRELWVYSVVNVFSAAILAHALLGRAGSAFLSWRPMVAVGQVSYGGYLFHALVLWGFRQWLLVGKDSPVGLRMGVFVMVWVLTVCLARWSFARFESPARRWLLARWGLAPKPSLAS
jgi:peptidoglycan/LPS O-acetylase OafA/YrhL